MKKRYLGLFILLSSMLGPFIISEEIVPYYASPLIFLLCMLGILAAAYLIQTELDDEKR